MDDGVAVTECPARPRLEICIGKRLVGIGEDAYGTHGKMKNGLPGDDVYFPVATVIIFYVQ